MQERFSPESYLHRAVRDVLTGEQHQVDDIVAHAGILLAACGAADESDRLVRHWRGTGERSAHELAAEPVRERAWAMLLACRVQRPEWAAELTPLDLDETERAHWRYLSRGEPALPPELTEGGTAARIIAGLAQLVDGESGPGRLRGLAAQAERLAARGEIYSATSALERWARQALGTTRPEIAMLAACRHLAPMLAEGLLAPHLNIGVEWPAECAGELSAALRTRFPGDGAHHGWAELVNRIMRLRAGGPQPATAPPAAGPGALEAAEARLGTRLPADYRQFLLTCDGLPADAVFPRLLGVAELVHVGPDIPISATSGEFGESVTIMLVHRRGEWHTVEWDSTFGPTEYTGFRDLLEHHVRLLEDS